MKQRLRGKKFQEYYKQAQLYYNSLTDIEKSHLMSAIIFELSHCDDPIVYETYIKILINIDLKLAQQVAAAVGATVPTTPGIPNDGKTSPSLSQTYYAPSTPTIATRRIAFLVADGFDNTQVQTIQAALKAANAFTFIIGPRRGLVYPAGVDPGSPTGGVPADHSWESQRSTGFDAILIPDGIKHVEDLSKSGRAIQWVREAFGHLKVIGAIGEGMCLSYSDWKIRRMLNGLLSYQVCSRRRDASWSTICASRYGCGHELIRRRDCREAKGSQRSTGWICGHVHSGSQQASQLRQGERWLR